VIVMLPVSYAVSVDTHRNLERRIVEVSKLSMSK